MIVYVDTSAALKLIIDEKESSALADFLTTAADRGDQLVSSMLLYTELHCASRRRLGIPSSAVNAVLRGISLVDLTRSDMVYAAALSNGLRSADAIHLAVALRLEADSLAAYDGELVAAAVDAGLSAVSPR
ncbi:putative nucleic acid-binding protein [Arthrobacter sp. CAN_A212]|uniref:type II toxin-antitoxin system VapC family toxin n=1 Tax=unclassified Arthrobacter TaxID=235627 RepID=UPI0018C9B378|nr:type II toxin-antitoxin system VapC family toxin [Arthrobacter sp. CAN_C5]MBP2217986.1 putative nucleic acid-binding protein [Arthrobacter sp. CAN_C5]